MNISNVAKFVATFLVRDILLLFESDFFNFVETFPESRFVLLSCLIFLRHFL